MIYTGIGARKTPPVILKAMHSMARFMASHDHTLRSGGAPGANTAFEEGSGVLQSGPKEIYLPYKAFNRNWSSLFDSTLEARKIAKLFHPAWSNLSCRGRDFMGRNSYQILGLDLKTPTDFVICWTPEGKVTGGTGQALRMALHYEIPIVNLGLLNLREANDKIEEIMS